MRRKSPEDRPDIGDERVEREDALFERLYARTFGQSLAQQRELDSKMTLVLAVGGALIAVVLVAAVWLSWSLAGSSEVAELRAETRLLAQKLDTELSSVTKTAGLELERLSEQLRGGRVRIDVALERLSAEVESTRARLVHLELVNSAPGATDSLDAAHERIDVLVVQSGLAYLSTCRPEPSSKITPSQLTRFDPGGIDGKPSRSLRELGKDGQQSGTLRAINALLSFKDTSERPTTWDDLDGSMRERLKVVRERIPLVVEKLCVRAAH